MTCQIPILTWPELTKNEIISFYNEIKTNQVLDIEWNNPGRLAPETYESFHEQKNSKHLEPEPTADSVKDNVPSNESQASMDNKFDMFDEFNEEDTEKEDEIFSLKLTHRKRSTDKKVATMDKILDDMRKKFDTEQTIASEKINEEDSQVQEMNVSMPIEVLPKETNEIDNSHISIEKTNVIEEEKNKTEILQLTNENKEVSLERLEIIPEVKVDSSVDSKEAETKNTFNTDIVTENHDVDMKVVQENIINSVSRPILNLMKPLSMETLNESSVNTSCIQFIGLDAGKVNEESIEDIVSKFLGNLLDTHYSN